MAEEDAEIALLRKMQADQENMARGEGGANGFADGEQPFTTENINNQEKKETVTVDQVLRAFSPSAPGTVSGSGDPSSLSSVPAVTVSGQEGSRSSSRASTRKPKTVGGFIADDSDEEYEAATPDFTISLQPSAANTPNRAIAPSPLHNSVSQADVKPESHNVSTAGASTSNTLSVNLSIAGVTPSVPASQVPNSAAPLASAPKARLPHDKVGILEDRIQEDPRGDIDAWHTLIDEHLSRNKLDETRSVYQRFFQVFPQAADDLVKYVQLELDHENWNLAETIFATSLMLAPNVKFWSTYMTYIRRMNDTNNDPTGNKRTLVAEAYKFVLDNVGIDRESGQLWLEYIQFLKTTPGMIGGTTWQDQNKSDKLRGVYHRAISTPMTTVNQLWKDYDQFEQTVNKGTARKFVQDHSPAYMTARSANSAYDNITRGLDRTTLPRLPPAHGFQGDDEYMQQVGLWKKWISWERDEDPLVLKETEKENWKSRILYVYKQAVAALRFWPEIWVEAAEWCFENDLTKEGDEFLDSGIVANPESCLLAFKKADRVETTTQAADVVEKGAVVRAPYDKLLDTMYGMHKQLKSRELQDLAQLEASSEVDDKISAILSRAEDDDDENEAEKRIREVNKANQVKAIQQGYVAQSQLIQRMISFAWIALMRAMRRVQGKGAVKDPIGGSRQVFSDARAKGKLTSDVYVASALMEHTVYKDAAGTKIFERGAKLFPEDEGFILEYLKHLLSLGDTTNARVTFETSVSRLTSKPDNVYKAKRLYSYFHKYESQYGELSQIQKLEKRMAELYPEDPKLSQFSKRFSDEGFDPTAARPIISPAAQLQPKRTLMQSIEQPPSIQNSPRPQYQEASPRPQFLQATNSPKRPFQADDENDFNRPRKLARGESPLKGAAGRRLDQQKRLQNQGTPQWQSNAPPFVIPRDITFLMSIIPRADLYHGSLVSPETLVRILSQTHVPDFGSWRASQQQQQQRPLQQQQYGYSYGR